MQLGVPELTHPGESASNGLAERSVQTFEDHFRTLNAALEANVGQTISIGHPVVEWLVVHSGNLFSKYAVNSDGRTG